MKAVVYGLGVIIFLAGSGLISSMAYLLFSWGGTAHMTWAHWTAWVLISVIGMGVSAIWGGTASLIVAMIRRGFIR